MPRLGRAQKELKEQRRAAGAATTQSAADPTDAVATSGAKAMPTTTKPASAPSANSLSTNQPINGGGMEARTLAIDEDETAHNAGSRSSTTPYAVSRRQDASSSVVPGSPVGMASDMSTSGESDLDLDAAADASRGNIALVDEHADGDEEDELVTGDATLDESSPEVKCMWEDCGQVFSSLAPFINHLHDEHVGIHKARYACEWTGCPRKGKGQTSRFALLSHLRSHTGEKPFTCPRPECDKSFTRSDALAKHMRVQHNINPVNTRGKHAALLGISGGGRTGKMRGEPDDDDWSSLLGERDSTGTRGNGGADVVGEELLELAEGEANGSLADIEQNLLLQDSKSPFFTYDNLFGAGARALSHVGVGTGRKGEAMPSSSSNVGPLPDSELGIVRDHSYGAGLSVDGEARDEEAIAREESEMAKVLEVGRRQWVLRERERGELRREAEAAATKHKRDQVDYLSEDEPSDGEGFTRRSKRARRSSTRFMQKKVESLSEMTTLKTLYLSEKAKLRWIIGENERMRSYLNELRTSERKEMMEKRLLLEKTLEAELGKDVGAIFSPPGSPLPADH